MQVFKIRLFVDARIFRFAEIGFFVPINRRRLTAKSQGQIAFGRSFQALLADRLDQQLEQGQDWHIRLIGKFFRESNKLRQNRTVCI